jgi:hypothetical protein
MCSFRSVYMYVCTYVNVREAIGQCTHVYVGINYGCVCLYTCTYLCITIDLYLRIEANIDVLYTIYCNLG